MTTKRLQLKQVDICNNNPKNMPSDDNYHHFNEFIFSSDIKLLGKLLHRYDFFCQTRNLPGDIVEIGVFKGSGIATFAKFIDIYCPNSNKKVVGFDLFETEKTAAILAENDSDIDQTTMNLVYSKVPLNERTKEKVAENLDGMGLDPKYLLIEGDVEQTLPEFLKNNPGFRISLLYIDVDIERPTYYALHHLWDRLLPGGVVLFDEYEYHKFSESAGVERFFRERQIPFNLRSTDWIAPTAYIIKQGF